MSVGIATARRDETETPERLLRAADQALYTAERNDRNRVEVYPALDQAGA